MEIIAVRQKNTEVTGCKTLSFSKTVCTVVAAPKTSGCLVQGVLSIAGLFLRLRVSIMINFAPILISSTTYHGSKKRRGAPDDEKNNYTVKKGKRSLAGVSLAPNWRRRRI